MIDWDSIIWFVPIYNAVPSVVAILIIGFIVVVLWHSYKFVKKYFWGAA